MKGNRFFNSVFFLGNQRGRKPSVYQSVAKPNTQGKTNRKLTDMGKCFIRRACDCQCPEGLP